MSHPNFMAVEHGTAHRSEHRRPSALISTKEDFMRTTLLVLASGFALSMSGALANPASTSAAAAAAPEPMAQSIAIPQATQTEWREDDQPRRMESMTSGMLDRLSASFRENAVAR
jgi:hypothetical protein